MPAHIEITAIYRNQKFRWDETVLIECELKEELCVDKPVITTKEIIQLCLSDDSKIPNEDHPDINTLRGQVLEFVWDSSQASRELFANDAKNGIVSPAICRFIEKASETFTKEKNSCDPLDPFSNFSSFITIKVEADEGELKTGLTYRFLGAYHNHPKYGRQFHAKSFVRSKPHGREGIIRYLIDAPWIGHSFAQRLWETYQGDAVRMLREQPEEVAAAVGLLLDRALEASAWLEKEKRIEDCKIELADLLAGRGFPKGTPRLAIKEWGNAAAEVIRKNPYKLMIFRGCGFALTDKLYLSLGLPPAALKRQVLCAWYGLARDQEGHTWATEGSFVQGLRDRIAGQDCQPKMAFAIGRRAPLGSPLLAGRRDENGRVWFAEGRKARNEETIAAKVAAMLHESQGSIAEHYPVLWPDVSDLDASDHQKQILASSLVAQIGCFTGTPGTGKTRTAALLIRKIIEEFGERAVAVCAPTGKAAVRITEAMNDYGVAIKARTIHSMLGVASRSDGAGWGFEHNERNPLDYQFIFVDESSMIDADLMASLLRACSLGTHVLFIGDTNQLPPVGHGAPLRDFIAAGVPTGELTEIWRNAGSIVKACQAIRFGRRFQVDEKVDPDHGKNLKLLECGKGEAAAARILEAVRNIRDRKIVDPVWDVQVIVAVNEKSPLARKKLNQALQAELNPFGEGAKGSPFRVGDKIICLKNGTMPLAKGYEGPGESSTSEGDEEDDSDHWESTDKDAKPTAFIANGDIGRVLAVEPKRTIAEFSNPSRVIVIPRAGGKSTKEGEGGQGGDSDSPSDSSSGGSSDSGCDFDLAYAVTCHKMQGSECPIVIIALDEYPGAKRVCSREWIYTGISRAKKVCFLVGKLATAYEFCRSEKLSKRKTFLVEEIREGLRELEAEEQAEQVEQTEGAIT